MVVKVQRLISEYQQIQQGNCELRAKVIELQQACESMMGELNVCVFERIIVQEQSTIIQDLEEKIDESVQEEQKHNLQSY